MNKKGMKSLLTMFLFVAAMVLPQRVLAAVNILKCEGWFESGYITWSPVDGATNYDVYVKSTSASTWTKLDKELVRKYPTYYRADAVGLKAGNYQFKVVASNNEEATSSQFTATAHDRSGFAHVGMPGGIGAYKNDGTLKDNAKVLYVWADNAKTVSTTVAINSKGGTATAIGLQDIIYWYQKGYEKTPLAIRIIGTIKAADMDRFDSSAEGLQVKGNSNYSEVPITMEGIGSDAAIHGFGILVRNCKSTEFRNFAIMLCMDDCLSLDSYNSNVWVHNMDFFYGSTGGDADQAKGDGTVDIKGLSKNCTVSYNHFFDSGKCSLGGMKSETTDCWMSYHHNWFDHSDSRHPRIRTAFYHIYNNYYDGNSKYGVGVTYGGSAFVENNYFRNCKFPMLISKQGTDAEGAGTFSGEAGGVIKAYNNVINGAKQIKYYNGSQTDGKWDAVKVTNRADAVSATALSGGSSYNSSADYAARTTYIENKMEDPSAVPTTIKSALGAGRMNHGDFIWKFNDAEDENYKVITALKSSIENYKSTLIGLADGTTIKNGGATTTVDGGEAGSDNNNPSWGGGDTPSDDEPSLDEKPYISSADGSDYYWFNEDNKTEINTWLSDEIITLKNGVSTSSFAPTYTNITYKKDSSGNATTEVQCETEKTGALQLGKASKAEATDGGSATFYCPNGVTAFELYTYRTGSTYYIVQTSTDGKNFTTIDKVVKGATGIYEKNLTGTINSTSAIWIRIINTSTGGLNIQGVRINQPAEEAPAPTIAESELKLTSEANISIEKDATSQITTSGNAGTLTYKSSDTNVATVDANGKITAIAQGNATITISDPGTSTVKGATLTVNVTITEPTSGEEPDEPIGSEDEEPAEDVICHFTDNSPSSDMVVVSGNIVNTKGTVTYDGKDYTYCTKIETDTKITITPTFDCDVTLVFDLASKKFKLDGTTYTTNADKKYTFAGTKGTTYTLTKGDAMNLFLIIFTPKQAPATPTLTTLVSAINDLKDPNNSTMTKTKVDEIADKIIGK